MKRTAHGALVVVLGLASVPLACISNSTAPVTVAPGNDSGPPAGEDAGTAPDATLPSADSAAPDAGTTPITDSSAPDTAIPDAAPAPLTLLVLSGGAPEPGVLVAFADSTGALLGSATTDATGTVTQLVAAGSQLTAALGTALNPNLVTIQDVAPGDVITLVDDGSSSSANFPDTYSFTLPATTWDASGTYEYAYAGPCYTVLPSPLYLQSTCETAGAYPAFANAVDSNGHEIAYTYQFANPVAPDGGLPDGDTTVPVTLSRAWTTSTATQTITATGLPATPDAGAVGSPSLSFAYAEVAEGVPLTLQGSPYTTDDAGAVSSAFTMHPGYPDFVQSEVIDTLSLNGGSVFSLAAAATRSAPSATSQVTSLALSTLPLFTKSSASAGANDAGAPSRPVVTWTSTGSLSAAAGIVAQVQWNTPPADGGGFVYGAWTILAPSTATSIIAPALPASMSGVSPSSTSSITTPPAVGAIQATFLPSYAVLRSKFGILPIFSTSGSVNLNLPPLPVNGTLFVTAIFQNQT